MKRIVSGIKPSGTLTLGNYIGAIRQFVQLQQTLSDTEFFLFVADMHAITVEQDPAQLKKHIREIAAIYLAAGLDQDKTVLFIQSEIQEHVELGYLLQSLTYMGELERMTQYKDKAKKQETGITSALFTYPVLMAADIILYDADYVPVGEDQKQHLEITRDIATRFNNRYGSFFKIPEPIIPKIGARIMDLQNPEQKMSKSSSSDKGYIALLDDPKVITKKIKSAVTDSYGKVQYDPINQPGVANLLQIYATLTNQEIDTIVDQYQTLGYKNFKEDLAVVVVDTLVPIQKKYQEILASNLLDHILDQGRTRAQEIAVKKLTKCKRLIGLGR
ncbi:MAG: tryptophan--tRNA ligase [Candidatus Izemoplasmatales bacterium]|jgi:tryptophanyl-tRNA synthetase|nr:tryptophan--tRNA ligase [Candidatus Izemoplasmatales bacterium]MDD4354284.1 tryptophan--tRNA ligase [Candidatus Izemoplasmatales bacterium]MDD4987288.1 tryptophan--tRNA ligase [Candidatus Izemoplasmatales bacterium]